jgi:ribonuclease HI
VDSLLGELSDLRLYTQGYADDLAILIEGFCLRTVSELMQRAVRVVDQWCGVNGLTVNPHKTELVLFTNRRARLGLVLPKLGGVELRLSESVKFLGVYLDNKLNWKRHVTEKCHKAILSLQQCRRIAGRRWGASPKVMRWIYTSVVRPMLSYAAVVWWTRVELRVARVMLTHVQRVACLSITGALRTTPTAALEALLDLTPLDLHIVGEAISTSVRLHQGGRWKRLVDARHTLIRDRAVAEILPLSIPCDRVERRYSFQNNFETVIPGRSEWLDPVLSMTPPVTTCFSDGSLINGRTGAGVLIQQDGLDQERSFALGRFATVFQAEVFAVLSCAERLQELDLKGKRVIIYSDSQACIRAIRGPRFTSRLVWDCAQALNNLGKANKVLVAWVPGHTGNPGNERADQLAKSGSSSSFVGPEPVVGVSTALRKTALQTWIRRQHHSRWRGLTDCRQARELFEGPNLRFTRGLLSLPKQMVRTVVGAITGHNLLNRHKVIMRLQQVSTCTACQEEPETSLHFLGQCPAWSRLRQRYMGSFLMEPGQIRKQELGSLVSFIKGTKRFD